MTATHHDELLLAEDPAPLGVETSWASLRQRLLDRYDIFVRQLTRYVGSPEQAREAVHETYLRLERSDPPTLVRNPDAYLFRMAMNIARNSWKIENRYLSGEETEALIALRDEGPDPERIAEGRSDMARLIRALSNLPPRRRAIFEASWGAGESHAVLAVRHGVHIRTIQRELDMAAAHVRKVWKEKG